MKFKVFTLLALLAMLVGIVACGEQATPTPSPTATPDPADITLVPCASEEMGIRGVVPEGWVEVKPGHFLRVPGNAPTLLGQVAFPGATIDQVTGQWQLPESVGRTETASLTWDLYSAELDWPDAGTLLWDIALAEGDAGVYTVVLVALTAEHAALPGADWQHPRGPGSSAEDDHPVVQVSREDAAAYCEWAGGQLPTEAQWEKAARGTDGRMWPWGNTYDGIRGSFCEAQCPIERWKDDSYDDGYAFTAPVGSFPSGASPYGALDMAGNVWEWVADWYDDSYYGDSSSESPSEPPSGTERAMRGGAWYDNEPWVRCTVRHQNPPWSRCDDVGFRCAVPLQAVSQSDTISRSCTVFAAAYGDTVLFGNNEDYVNPNTYYWIIPSSDGNYGGVYVGFDDFVPQGGINEKGLAFDTNGLPPADINPHSELPAPPPGWIVKTIMRKAATVEQAVDIARRYHRYNWGLPMKYQVLLADATGDAVVISAGPDGELAFTRKQEGDRVLVSTNFNRANPDNRYGDLPCWRYDTATTMLEEIQGEEDLTIDYFRSILDAVHVEGAETNTVYSNVFDLRNGVIYLYHWHQFDEVIVLNVAEELARSSGHTEPYRIHDLVSAETADRADREYQRYQGNVDASVWDHVAKGWLFLVAGSLTVVILGVVLGTRLPIRTLPVWVAIVAVFGPFGLLAYLLLYRQSQVARKTWQRAFDATLCRTAVYIIWLTLAIAHCVYHLPDSGPMSILALAYVLPFFVFLLVLGGPLVASRLGVGYWAALHRVALMELVSINLGFVGMFPTVVFLENRWFPDPLAFDNFLIWFMMSLAAITGVLVLYPFNLWVARHKFVNWPIWLVAGGDSSRGIVALPTLRNAWRVLLLSFALFIGALAVCRRNKVDRVFQVKTGI